MFLSFISLLKSILFFLLLFLGTWSTAQTTISGNIIDSESKEPIEGAAVYIEQLNLYEETDEHGGFKFDLTIDKPITVVLECSYVGYVTKPKAVKVKPNTTNDIIIGLTLDATINVIIDGDKKGVNGSEGEFVTVEKEAIEDAPSITQNLEEALPFIAPGVQPGTSGELSSQYSVRGGNFDENLVFVNDFRIFRPQLVRSGEQEGLSFPNLDLTKRINFSSGGFTSEYGDKLSSVLDITYKKPKEFHGSIMASLLGASAHLEGSIPVKKDKSKNISYLLGARYKNTNLLLNSLETEGEYRPQFLDFQGYLSYQVSDNWTVDAIANLSNSQFEFIPETRTTNLGVINKAIQFTSLFEGLEDDQFINNMAGVSALYTQPEGKYFLKFLGSNYYSDESETFDITGFYSLSEIETNPVSDNFQEPIATLGEGTNQKFGRNFLTSQITNLSHKGGLEWGKKKATTKFLEWGAETQIQVVEDRLNEWERLDSAGFTVPSSSTGLELSRPVYANNSINSIRYFTYLQNTWHINDSIKDLKITGGLRANYWDLNEEVNISPRLLVLYQPKKSGKNITYKLATGLYTHQPFYREYRRPNGTINRDIKSQKSIHVVAGLIKDVKWWNRDFRIITEAYYKHLWDLISYDLENVKIRYSGENDATGYAIGLDMRLNGEFVPGVESYLNLSILRTRESLNDVQHLKVDEGEIDNTSTTSDVPRPTDQLVNLAVLFQDYLNKHENIGINLNLVFGSGLPFGVPNDNTELRNTFRFSPYYRVDAGFIFQLWKSSWEDKKPDHLLRFLDNAWLSLEVFNLLDVKNSTSNFWLTTNQGQQFAIPNFTTSRRINVKVKLKF